MLPLLFDLPLHIYYIDVIRIYFGGASSITPGAFCQSAAFLRKNFEEQLMELRKKAPCLFGEASVVIMVVGKHGKLTIQK